MAFLDILIFLVCSIVVLCYWSWSWWRQRSSLPTNWPLVGMAPKLLYNAPRVHDLAVDVMTKSGGTFEFKGPCFAKMDMIVTADPANVHYILSKNFSNYPKGPEFKKIFDVWGDGMFNAEAEMWEAQRKVTVAVMNHPKFKALLERITWEKVEKGLIPVLDHFSNLGESVDLEELFDRLSFDCVSMVVLGHDPRCLTLDLPHVPCLKAFADMEEALISRHFLPESCWKLQRWLQIGNEKKMSKACACLDRYLYECISKHEEAIAQKMEEDDEYILLSVYLKAYKENYAIPTNTKKFLRDVTLNLMLAGKDTINAALSWLFWLIVINPSVETKIREEINANLHVKDGEYWRLFDREESRKLVYLHGALCESLRFFPPVPLQHKASVEADILPSGHRIDPNTMTVISFYAMGRMETIWGKDCLEFKPERWISEQGGSRNEPSHKFAVFNAGPRTCLGKEMTFIQMKIVAATIICNYQIQLAEGHPVSPKTSIILHMKHGLKAKIVKTSV